MKRLKKIPGKLLALTSAMGLSAAFAAPVAPAVYQRTTNTESIELSNIDEAGSVALPISVEPAPPASSQAAPAAKAPVASAAPAEPQARAKVKKMIRKPDGTEEEVWVDADEDTKTADQANGSASDVTSKKSDNWGSFGFSSPSGSSGGYAGGGYTPGGTGNNTGTTNSGSTGGTTASNGGSAGDSTSGSTASNGGSTGGNPAGAGSNTTSPTPTPTTALETKLASYRDMLLADVANAHVANPAITRRYQAMNRSAYQSRFGF